MRFLVRRNKIFVAWRKVCVIAFFQFGLVAMVEATNFDCNNLSEAKTGRVDQLLVRYLAWTEDRCIIIQTLVFGGAGKVKVEKEICSLNGKSFYDGFTHVGLEEGRFKNGTLSFDIETISLPPIIEEKLHCKVIFYNDLADHLSCDKKDALPEAHECSCESFDSRAIKRPGTDMKNRANLTKVLLPESTAPNVTKFTSAINENRGPQTDKVSPFFEVKRN